jgi:hypothetical protein
MYDEPIFEIQLTGTHDSCQIVAIAPDGSRERSVSNKLDRHLVRALKQIQVELSRAAQTPRGTAVPAAFFITPQMLRSTGERLFDAVFTGKVSALYRRWYNAIGATNIPRIGVKLINAVPEFSALPWELLYDSEIKQYICFSSKTIFMRGIEADDLSTTRPFPINVLAVSARPKTVGENSIPEIDVDGEKDILEDALADLEAQNKITLSYAASSSYEGIRDRLENPQDIRGWDVFHFIGHGGLDDRTQEGYVIFQAEGDTRGVAVSADSLVDLLNLPRRLQLVVLNSCSGAESKPGELFSSSAIKLITAGIPAVIAMQTTISDDAAKEFARRFYARLSRGESIQKAVTDSRAIMKIEFPYECFSPVLYLRSDGILFKDEFI